MFIDGRIHVYLRAFINVGWRSFTDTAVGYYCIECYREKDDDDAEDVTVASNDNNVDDDVNGDSYADDYDDDDGNNNNSENYYDLIDHVNRERSCSVEILLRIG